MPTVEKQFHNKNMIRPKICILHITKFSLTTIRLCDKYKLLSHFYQLNGIIESDNDLTLDFKLTL